MAKPVILAGKYEGQETYTLLSGGKIYLFAYNPKKGNNREAFIESVGREFAAEVESRGFYELPEIKNGTILTRHGVEKVDVSALEKVLAVELSHFSEEAIVELKKLKRAS